MNKVCMLLKQFSFAAALVGSFALANQANAATFRIINTDPPGVGYNDPTPAAPVGLNPGRTVGEQRLIATNFVGSIWAAALGGNDVIEVAASFSPQQCNATEGILASAGPVTVWWDFPSARFANTLYPAALANRLARQDLDATSGDPLAEIGVFSNGSLGQAGCLEGFSWYYGLDDRAPANTFDYVTTILHEFGHGLGFLSFADETTGELFLGRPSIWEQYLVDITTNKLWVNMTDAERKASAVKNQRLAWNGNQSRTAGLQTLTAPVDLLDVVIADRAGVESIPSALPVAGFGPVAGSRGAAGLLGLLDDRRAPGPACNPLTSSQRNGLRNRVAVIDRGGCAFADKVANAQAAGAVAVVFVNNLPIFFGRPPFGSPTTDIRIPAAFISQQDGVRLRNGPRSAVLSESRRPLGTDPSRRVLMYAPHVVEPGSSVSHWDVSATPNLLMEPVAVGDESRALRPPTDLTLPLLRDIGW